MNVADTSGQSLASRDRELPDIPIDADEIERRHDKIRTCMAQEGIDTLVVHSSPLRPFSVHYAANYDLIGEGAMVVVSSSQAPVLYISEEWDISRARSVSPIQDIRHAGDLPEVEGALLRGKNAAVTGLEWVGSAFVEKVAAAAGGDIRGVSPVLERAARRKTPVERALIRQAAALADYGFERGFETLNPGMTEYELAAEIEYAMRAAGAVDNFGLLTAGKHNRAIGLPTDKKVEAGDFLIFEITPARLGRNYSAQLCRTMSMGRASDEAREKFKILAEAMEAGLQAVKPGATAAEIVIAQDDVISRYGYADYCRPPYMRARGHGFGLGRIDLARENLQQLEPDMAMIVHPNQYFPELGYMALGEMVIVTDTGAERICTLRPEIYERV